MGKHSGSPATNDGKDGRHGGASKDAQSTGGGKGGTPATTTKNAEKKK